MIDYWRGRLGKAERLILETLAQEYPDALTKRKWRPRLATKRTAAVSTTPWGGGGPWSWSKVVANSRQATTCSTANRVEKSDVGEIIESEPLDLGLML